MLHSTKHKKKVKCSGLPLVTSWKSGQAQQPTRVRALSLLFASLFLSRFVAGPCTFAKRQAVEKSGSLFYSRIIMYARDGFFLS